MGNYLFGILLLLGTLKYFFILKKKLTFPISGSRARSTIVRSSIMSQCNGTIKEASEGDSSITDQGDIDMQQFDEFFLKTQFFLNCFFLGSSVDDEEYQDDHEEDHEPDDHKNQGPRKGGPNLDDSAVGQSDSSGLVNSLDGEDEEDEEDEDTVFDSEAISTENVIKKNAIFSPTAGRRRSRQQSTSLMRHPIEDDNLKDYHEHRLVAGRDPFDISYNLYSMVVSLINFLLFFFFNFMQSFRDF